MKNYQSIVVAALCGQLSSLCCLVTTEEDEDGNPIGPRPIDTYLQLRSRFGAVSTRELVQLGCSCARPADGAPLTGKELTKLSLDEIKIRVLLCGAIDELTCLCQAPSPDLPVLPDQVFGPSKRMVSDWVEVIINMSGTGGLMALLDIACTCRVESPPPEEAKPTPDVVPPPVVPPPGEKDEPAPAPVAYDPCVLPPPGDDGGTGPNTLIPEEQVIT